jgi:hypothetical protein
MMKMNICDSLWDCFMTRLLTHIAEIMRFSAFFILNFSFPFTQFITTFFNNEIEPWIVTSLYISQNEIGYIFKHFHSSYFCVGSWTTKTITITRRWLTAAYVNKNEKRKRRKIKSETTVNWRWRDLINSCRSLFRVQISNKSCINSVLNEDGRMKMRWWWWCLHNAGSYLHV